MIRRPPSSPLFPYTTLFRSADSLAVKKLLPQIVAWNGPVYFRLCRNELPEIFTEAYAPVIGKGFTLMDGEDATVIACGVMVARSIEAARLLAKEGIHLRVVEMHTIKPLDTDLVVRCAQETGAIVTAEEHSII